MYTKQEVSKQKQAFWTAFGKYMQPVLSADGLDIGWVNYKTGIAGIGFKMDVDNKRAEIAIVLSHTDTALQQRLYDNFVLLQNMLPDLPEAGDWLWQPAIPDEYGKPISKISKQLTGVSIFRQEDWPAVISFLKPHIIALDEFWSMAKDSFDAIA
jgi:hypothetical protein